MKEVCVKIQESEEVLRHSSNVRDLATEFSVFLGWGAKEIQTIRLGAFIHDVGKSFIPAEILFKSGRLTAEEYEIVKEHCRKGYVYLKSEYPMIERDLLAIVLEHHERVDGKGYPLGLKGDDIHPYAKLISLCDVYDAITSTRSYKVAYSSRYALNAIEEGLGTQFDEELGQQFLAFMKEKRKAQRQSASLKPL